VPSRRGRYPIALGPTGTGISFSDSVTLARERERIYTREMHRLHRYGLVSRNCVTAIFETVNASFDGSVELSRERLGGHVGGSYSLAFIPFVSANQVNQRYRVTRQETILSYRQQRLREMRQRENSVWVTLRESNPFTAESYQRHSDDSFFIFFSDEAPLLRPIFGAINLVAALGQTVVGIVSAPFDRGEVLIRGLRGALVSLPELAFMNIRKGSNEWIPIEYRDLAPLVVLSEARSDSFAVEAEAAQVLD
jgi:hypothetical protein